METISPARAAQLRYCAKYPDRKRFTRRKCLAKIYGLTVEEYNQRIEEPCAICGKKQKRMALDHDHVTGENRGTLCISCNAKLGWFEINRTKVAAYLAGGVSSKQ